jgi:hypothetical protein
LFAVGCCSVLTIEQSHFLPSTEALQKVYRNRTVTFQNRTHVVFEGENIGEFLLHNGTLIGKAR